MGIPSYYRKLADHTKGLVSKSYEGKLQALYFDFNCLIYYCARRSNSSLPPYPGDNGNDEWERLLLEDIVKYIVHIWQAVGQPPEVFLALDGVVPMAKIKQQRMRRFKSAWLAKKEKEEGIRDGSPSWDTNCITPGTMFMKRLAQRLELLCSKHTHWSVSAADEPGEGEHKIMKRLRQRAASSDPICIYGLDADLILLTLLNAKSPAYLLREDAELGLNGMGEEEYSFFSIEILKKTLPPDLPILTYVAGMSLLGNDFLPHGLTMKIKHDGHAKLLSSLADLQAKGQPFVDETNGIYTINLNTLKDLCESWSTEENTRMLSLIKKKLMMSRSAERTLEMKPLEWMVEKDLVWKNESGWNLDPTWRSTYQTKWLQCDGEADVRSVCREYIYGLQWVLDYYTGQRPVQMGWYFSRLVPPLWCHLAAYLESSPSIETPWKQTDPIQPHEQLAMVLPLESWHFLEDPSLRSLPKQFPQYWPLEFGFFSAGRTRLWECEPYLPVLPVERIRLK